MRVFVIADASKRKAKPIALLTWEPGGKQGWFSLELSSACGEDDVPLSLSFCVRKEGRRATPEESEQWVRSRIVPEDRHNITEVLMANGLSKYDEVSLLAACKGRSSDDDYLVYEIDLPGEMLNELAAGPEGEWSARGMSRADWVIATAERRLLRRGIGYAVVGLGESAGVSPAMTGTCSGAPEQPAAQRIGELIRSRRKEAGLTQKQLAARAGITQTVLSRVESGAGNPTLSLLEEIAVALNARLNVSLDVD